MASKNKSKPATSTGFFNPGAWIASFKKAAPSEEKTSSVSTGRRPSHPTKRIAADHTRKLSKKEKAQQKKAKRLNGKRRHG